MQGLDWGAIYGRLLSESELDNSPQIEDTDAGSGEFDYLPGINHPYRLGDDRRRCCECLNRAWNGRCIAVSSGLVVAARGYTPNPEWLRRCEGYKPCKSDPDQRNGRDRWPGIWAFK
ncbi:MAG: hypothetical protein RIR18_1283 [Pseudomonadota bacterium]